MVNTCAVTAEAVRQARQAIRAHQARAARRAHRRHRLRGADRAADFRRHAGGRSRARQRGKARRRGVGRRRAERVRVNDIMAVHETAAASGRRHSRATPAPSCRCRTAATIAAPSASSRSAAAIRARCRWATWSRRCARLAEQRLSRGRADRRRYHQLWRRSAGAPRLGALVQADPASEVPELTRLRLSSIDSVEADDDLLDALAQTSRG